MLGDYPTHERLVRDLVAYSGETAVFVNYTPSPEAQYPVAIHQAYAATKWVSENGGELNVDGRRLAVVGNSVGGNMAAVVSLMAKDRGGPAIRFQGLMWPVTDANFDTESYHEFADGRFLTRNMMKWFWDNYTTNASERMEIYASPLRAMTEELARLAAGLGADGRERRAPRRRRRVRAKAGRGRRRRDRRSLQRHDPRLGPAQSDQPGPGDAGLAPANGRRAEAPAALVFRISCRFRTSRRHTAGRGGSRPQRLHCVESSPFR